MNREDKAAAISELGEGIGKATNAFVIAFKGITVPQVTELRRQVRDTNSTYVVVKNTLALIAVKDSPLTALKDQFSGPTAVAFNRTDAVALAKALTKFAKDVPTISFKGAMLNGQIVPADQIQAIANLPSRNELIAKLLYVCRLRSADGDRTAGQHPQSLRWYSIRSPSSAAKRQMPPQPRQTHSNDSRPGPEPRRMRLNDSTLFGG
jgi:large subunit ribosomal protein L10